MCAKQRVGEGLNLHFDRVQKQIWQWSPVAIAFAVPLVAKYGTYWALGSNSPDLNWSTPFWVRFGANSVSFALYAAVAGICLWGSRYFGPQFPRKQPPSWWIRIAVAGVLVEKLSALLGVLMAWGVKSLFGVQSPVFSPHPYESPIEYLWPISFLLIQAPLTEELLYRVFLFSSLVPRFGRIAAYVIGSLAFAWVHQLELLEHVGAGLGLTLVWELTGRYEAVVLTHFLVNLPGVLRLLGPVGWTLIAAEMAAILWVSYRNDGAIFSKAWNSLPNAYRSAELTERLGNQ